MTDDEINKAIAEACGWKLLANNRWTKPCGIYADLPNYTADLNAMHEAEVSCIIPMTTPCFYDTLQSIIFRDKEMTDVNPKIFSAWLTHATASQRAEAFLRTINLWKP